MYCVRSIGQDDSERALYAASASFELKPGFPLRTSREMAGILAFGPSFQPDGSSSLSQASRTLVMRVSQMHVPQVGTGTHRTSGA